MAWKARLHKIREYGQKDDVARVEVEYFDSVSGKSFVDSMELNFNQLQSPNDLRSMVQDKLGKLNAFRANLETLKTRIGQEIQ